MLTLSDQGASSLSNILVFVLVARSFDSGEVVGAFSAAMIAYQIVVGLTRALGGQTFLSLYSHLSPDARRHVVPDLLAMTLLMALLSTGALGVISLITGGMLGSAFLSLALIMPALLLQDTWRYALVVDRPGATLLLDLLWLAAVVLAFALVPDNADLSWFITIWGLGAMGGAFLGFLLARIDRLGMNPLRWVTDHREVGIRYAGEFATTQGTNNVVTSSLGFVADLSTLGTVRASQVYYGPLNTLLGGFYLAVVPEGAQLRHSPVRMRQLLLKVTMGLTAVAGVWMFVGLVLPASWGRAALGETWTDAHQLIIPMGLAMVASGVMSGARFGLRSLADARRSLRVKVMTTPFLVVLPLLGAVTSGAVGFATGFFLARTFAAVVSWKAFNEALAAHAQGDEAGTDPDEANSARTELPTG
jgi:hypothetical protein